jgi:hypothetical protein
LPDAEAWKTNMEMLSCLPRFTMLVVEIEPYHHIVILPKDFDLCLGGSKAYPTCLASDVDVASPQGSQNLVNANESEARNHPTPQSVPVTPTRTDV